MLPTIIKLPYSIKTFVLTILSDRLTQVILCVKFSTLPPYCFGDNFAQKKLSIRLSYQNFSERINKMSGNSMRDKSSNIQWRSLNVI